MDKKRRYQGKARRISSLGIIKINKNLIMKYLYIYSILLIVGCSNRNDITTQLLNDKKAINDSILEANRLEKFYMSRSKSEIHSGEDSLKWSASADSAGYFFRKGMDLKQRLKALEFSIDSISRMK